MARRAATHNGRAGKRGAFSAKHNDRSFDTSTTDHIDPTLTPQNKNIRFGDLGAKTNEEHELAFYEAHFGESLERKNAAYRDKGKPGQIKTMEQYYRSTRSCPEETLYTAGKDVDPQVLWKIYLEHQAWKAERYPQCQTLDASLHVDEPNAMPHVHERSVWIGHDSKGMEVVGQSKALSEMGVLPPDPEAKYGKHNNAKMTFTRECREHFIQVCRAHGLEITEEPLPSEKVGLELMEYKIQHAQERVLDAQKQLQDTKDKLIPMRGEFEARKALIGDVDAMMYPPEVRTISKGLIKKQEYVEVPKELWEAKWLSADAKKDLVRATEALNQAIAEFKRTSTGRRIGELEKTVRELQSDVKELSAQNQRLSVELQRRNNIDKDWTDAVNKTLSRLPRDQARRFVEEFKKTRAIEPIQQDSRDSYNNEDR